MHLMSFEWIADFVAIAVLIVLGALYAYGRRHFERGGHASVEKSDSAPPACEAGLATKLRIRLTRRR